MECWCHVDVHVAAELWLLWQLVEAISTPFLKQKIGLIDKGEENLTAITVADLQ